MSNESDFDLLNKAMLKYKKKSPVREGERKFKKIEKKERKNESSIDARICHHENIFSEKGSVFCTDCGEQVNKTIVDNKPWKFHNPIDTKRISDPNGMHLRKKPESNIYKDLEHLSFSEDILALSNDYYRQSTNGKIYRGSKRKSIVFGCVFHACKTLKKPISSSNLMTMFSIELKEASDGLKTVKLNAPKDSQIKTCYVTPEDFIEDIMEELSCCERDKESVKNLYGKIHNRSSQLNRSRPKSIAAALIFYWIRKNNKDITIKEFTRKVELSELTITKIKKLIEEILEKKSTS